MDMEYDYGIIPIIVVILTLIIGRVLYNFLKQQNSVRHMEEVL